MSMSDTERRDAALEFMHAHRMRVPDADLEAVREALSDFIVEATKHLSALPMPKLLQDAYTFAEGFYASDDVSLDAMDVTRFSEVKELTELTGIWVAAWVWVSKEDLEGVSDGVADSQSGSVSA